MRRVSWFLIYNFMFWISISSVAAHDIPFNEHSIENRDDHGNCGGVFQYDDDIHVLAYRPSNDDWIEDLGVIVLRMSSLLSSEDFEYVRDLLDVLLPSMVEVLGAPVTLDTLTVEIRSDINLVYYRCAGNIIAMTPFYPDPETGTDNSWDNVFIHELVHAFQDDLLCRGNFPSWLIEGMADAGRYFVAELASETSGREVRRRRFDQRMVVYDLYNNAGEQVLGGTRKLAYRLDLDFLYQNAAGSMIVPSLAQMAVGFQSPHPMERLTAELRVEMNASSAHQVFEAIDRAWSAPVDGVTPPSRWVRSRGVTCPSVRDGEFVALVPSYAYNNVNPPKLRILRFMREGLQWEYQTPLGELAFVGANTRVKMNINTYFRPLVPDLPEGAYLVDLQGSAEDGEELTARTWILIINPAFTEEPLWDGVAVVFTDRNGCPVDIPHEDLSVNGRIVAKVPGGVIALPYSGNLGTLTFKMNGNIIGTVTATGPLPRMVVIPVENYDQKQVVTWKPYHPAGGDRVMVTFRFDRSSLAPDGNEDIEVVLYNPDGTTEDRSVMVPLEGFAGLFTAELTVPSDIAHGILQFEKGTSTHKGCSFYPCFWYWGYEFETRAEHAADQFSSKFDGAYLVVTFEEVVDAGNLILRIAANPDGPWTDLPEVEAIHNGNEVRWNIFDLIGDGAYFRVVRTGGEEDRVLLTEYVAPAPTAVRLVAGTPFPNPSRGAVRWPIEVTSPANATFEVYDVAGRRVFSNGRTALHPGVEVFQWDGRYRDDPAAPGIYFMRIVGQGYDFKRKVVLVR